MKKILIALLVLSISLVVAVPSFAGSTNKAPNNGLHLQIDGDAKGTKLSGPIHLEFVKSCTDPDNFATCDFWSLNVSVRLSQGSTTKTFVGTVEAGVYQVPGVIMPFSLANEEYTRFALINFPTVAGTGSYDPQFPGDPLFQAPLGVQAVAFFFPGKCLDTTAGCEGTNAVGILVKDVALESQALDNVSQNIHQIINLTLAVD